MKNQYLPALLLVFWGMIYFASCSAVIEPDISKKTVTIEAPADQYQSASYNINFWWDAVDNALSYRLQVVKPTFANPAALVLDTVVKSNKFSINLSPGNYQWHVLAQNGSSATVYSIAKSFTVLQSSIKQQSVQLSSPANNTLTNQSPVSLQWGSVYGATKYQLQIDTNGFADTTKLIYNQTLPGLQYSFSFPKDQVYQWRVRAQNDTAKALWSTVNTITYDHTPPAQVTVLSPANGATVVQPATLQWNSATTAVKYRLYAFKSDSVTTYGTTFPMILTGTSYSFSGTSGDKVYWKVTAIDAAGNESTASVLRYFILQ